MNLRGYSKLSMQDALQALDEMPKERGGKGYYAGRHVRSAVGRTYTRMDGDRFQISQTAGMASAVCSGVVSESGGKTVIDLAVTEGLIPSRYWLMLVVIPALLVPVMYFLFGWMAAAGALVLFFGALHGYMIRRVDVSFLLTCLSDVLGGVEWKPIIP